MDFSRSRYEILEELRDYCNQVASVVGRMVVRIFGFTDLIALQRADDLGRAPQLTNILGDVREDAIDMGRVYLPHDDLARFVGPESALINGESYPAGWRAPIAPQVERAREYFTQRLRGTALHCRAVPAPAGRRWPPLGRAPQEDRASNPGLLLQVPALHSPSATGAGASP